MINDPERPVPVWVTGHSLGGAYATHCWQGLLATFRLNTYDENRVIRDLFTFGSPRVGDKTYASYPNDIKTSQRSWRFVNGSDFVATLPYSFFGYQHVDRQVVISPEKIELSDNELVPPEGFMKDTYVGHLLGFPQHGLDSYWESLTRGGKSLKAGSWPESQRDVTPPPYSNLVTWSLGVYHPREFVPSESHADSKPAEESVLQGNDRRIPVDPYDYEENGKWRSVVKVQSMFRPRNRPDPIWTMGTGWLIREDLVVTASHNVYSKSYGGQAERIKCWIGYRGRKYASDPGVQHRKALNIVTTNSWYSMSSERQRDVALIQVSAPFEGGVNPFIFMDTDTKLVDQYLTVVGYPGDKKIQDENGNEDPGAEMWFHSERITFDLERDAGMIMYDIDTFGGQSGAPIPQGGWVARYWNTLLWRRRLKLSELWQCHWRNLWQ
ncbi:uncharacterized protein LDX57_002625 [Aspergillus melleus]|uniref:uncharacterized protein n=1 Tax=Aspergillus melleus TaxID=138277 RepID=UPI001E8D6D32|nr:uncharacterized protein LDX57_002625 [Aspergillus melleus]KAH8424881.1 hypothetical protein LDX57_002625 [Aspergillus melleus]